MGSQIGTDELKDFKVRLGIDLKDILFEGSCSERPTPNSRDDDIAFYCRNVIFESKKSKNKSDENLSPELR